MVDREKIIKALENAEEISDGTLIMSDQFRDVLIALLKEQEKLVDVDALREKLGLAKDCAKCKQNTRACQYDSHFSLMDFCERFDMAIEELMQEGR